MDLTDYFISFGVVVYDFVDTNCPYTGDMRNRRTKSTLLLFTVSRINNIGVTGVTMRENDHDMQTQIDYEHVPDDVWERGFQSSSLILTPIEKGTDSSSLGIQGVVTEAMYLGYKIGFLNTRDWN